MLFQDFNKCEFVVDQYVGGFPANSGTERVNFVRNGDRFFKIGANWLKLF